jgi:CubicO group peptidase (beta-lactamase class C family)
MREQALPATLRARLESFLERIRTETGVPGIGAGVSIRGERLVVAVGSRVAGRVAPLTAAARYRLGCVTKLLLAALALELERDGVLDLRAPIGAHLAELRECEHGRNVRVEHLLAHTSGYRGTHLLDPRTRVDSWPDFVAYLRAAPALFPPGAVFSYEHTEAVLLGEIISRVTGESSLALVAARLLAPLGIVAAEREVAEDPASAGGHRFDERTRVFLPLEAWPALPPFWLPAFSAFTLTIEDLLAIAEAVSGLGRTRACAALLAPTTRAALATSVVRLPPTAGGPLGELLPVAFARGTGELRDGSRGNTGVSAGQCLGLRFDSYAGICVAVALNARMPYLRDFLLATITRELVGSSDAPRAPPPCVDLASFAGTYLGPGAGTLRARLEDESLLCDIGREHRTETLRIEVALDGSGALVLRTPIPQLSIGFFTEPRSAARGLMLGLSAYRRVAD